MSAHDEHSHGEPRHQAFPEASPEAGPTSAKRVAGLTVLAQPTSSAPSRRAKHQWRGPTEKSGGITLVESTKQEFPLGADVLDDSDDGVSRRGFVQLLGASFAVGSVACYRPNQKIVPYVRRPAEIVPGNALHYATAVSHDGVGAGLLVEAHEARPTKVEGNPDHVENHGAATAQDQALVLQLYDDSRAKQLTRDGQPVAWRTFLGDISARAKGWEADGGAKLRFLVEPTSSPLLLDLRARVQRRFPKAKFVAANAATGPSAAAEGARVAFGRPLEPRHDLTNAQVIVSLDSDFLNQGSESLKLSQEFTARRVPGDWMNRLYVVEPAMSVTGTMADHRLRVRGLDIAAVAQALAAQLAQLGVGGQALSSYANLPRGGQSEIDGRWVAAAARDLSRHAGRSVVIAGERQPAAVHALVAAINAALGNIGTTVSFVAPRDPAAGGAGLAGLVEELAAGSVETLVITAWNPVYAAPSDYKLDRLLARIPETIYYTLYEDETAAVTKTLVPAAHTLESWGDLRGLDGSVLLVQPLISPLWSGITEADLLSAFVDQGDQGAHALLREFWRAQVGQGAVAGVAAGQFDQAWEGWLAKGLIPGTAPKAESGLTVTAPAVAGALGPVLQRSPAGDGLELSFAFCSKVGDGRWANSVWLQELPDPITKITWDNAFLVSLGTAKQLKLETGDIVKLTLRGSELTGPLCVAPGHADNAVTIALGYGRRGAAESLARDVGVNANLLRSSESPWFERGATLARTRGGYRFGITQEHWKMEGREPAISTTLAEVTKHDSEVNELLEGRRGLIKEQIHAPVDYSKQTYKWAMAIDLTKCTGCSACIVACQSENNIPVVGRENVRIGREMQWLRIDRYFEAKDHGLGKNEDLEDEVEVVTQPLACVHCETAPCEYVCPVNATVHSDEGLNEMVYNRCIGTRYCSNNCPYKVRRFNFMDYNGMDFNRDTSATVRMRANPNVTVRSRGVMEKCTYCVQRIERARIDTRVQGRQIADLELKTACQQTCPANAIVFGNLNDTNSAVSKALADPRRYDLLHELNTRPRTGYLARVRNPNPELA